MLAVEPIELLSGHLERDMETQDEMVELKQTIYHKCTLVDRLMEFLLKQTVHTGTWRCVMKSSWHTVARVKSILGGSSWPSE